MSSIMSHDYLSYCTAECDIISLATRLAGAREENDHSMVLYGRRRVTDYVIFTLSVVFWCGASRKF